MSFYPEDKPHQIQNFETEVNPPSTILEVLPPEYVKPFPGQSPFKILQMNINLYWQKFLIWFSNLAIATKLLVGVLGLIFAYAIAQAMLKLVASIISVALFLVLVYLGYKFWVSGAETNQQ